MTRIQEKNETDSNTEPWPEVDHIQPTNGVNWTYFYKAILLVEGQPIHYRQWVPYYHSSADD